MKDVTIRRLSRFHTALYRLTGGRVGNRLVDNDMLLLTTSGRTSGRPHVVPLLYLRDGESLVLVASYGGRPRNPDWYLNLSADPLVATQVLDEHRRWLARTASSAERQSWWPRIVEAYPGYAEYQARTDREIPVVILDPAPALTSDGVSGASPASP
jgi:deazaflavin-dependent oxidoreductase (nitroreductase family)